MANSTKLILLVLFFAALITLIVFGLARKPTDRGEQRVNVSTELLEQQDNKQENVTNRNSSIANEWRWPETQNAANPNDAGHEKLFTSQSVHDALQAVEVDEYGDLILDNNARFALDEALERIHKQLDSEALQSLIDVIKQALPGKLGEQTAQLVKDYNRFLGAQSEFNQLHEYSNRGPQTLATIEQDRGLYSELQTLRELHLGAETAQRLFQESDANAQFMFDMMSLDLETNLTPDEIARKRAEIQKRLAEQTSQ